MRLASMKLIGALGIVAAWAVSANAAPIVPNPVSANSPNIVKVQGACILWGYHLTYWGECVPYGWRHGWGHYGWRHHYYRGHWRRYY
jgi:hypothetical protein